MFVLVSILTVVIFAAWHLNIKLCSYWKRRSIPFVPATSLFSKDIFKSFLLTPTTLSEIYGKAAGRSYIGFYQMREPVLLICGPEMINQILYKEFYSFSSTRKPECSTESDPLSQHLLALNGEKWKTMRSKLSPVFTSGKLKNMFPIIDSNVNDSMDFLDENQGIPIDVEDYCSKLSVSSILSCSFGLDHSCTDENNEKFIHVGKMAFEPGYWKLMKSRFRMMFPRLFKFLRLEGYVKGHADFCANFIKEVIEHRKLTGFNRPDFVEILMKLWNDDNTNNESVSDSLIIAQVFSFLVAGYETTTTTLCCALFELAQDPQLAEKLRTEAKDTLETRGSLDYEAINRMEFLDRVIKEVLRKHPPVIFIPRVCTKATTLPGTTLRIDEGMQLMIPVLSLQRDSRFYPYPEEFLPQRFSKHSADISKPDSPYLPFSDGPRKCIGMRFALLELKVALAKIVLDFDFQLDGSTPRSIAIEEYARTYKIKNQIKIIFKRRNNLARNSSCTQES